MTTEECLISFTPALKKCDINRDTIQAADCDRTLNVIMDQVLNPKQPWFFWGRPHANLLVVTS